MNFREYTEKASVTADFDNGVVPGPYYCAIGLAGETGELLEHIKKMARNDGGFLTDERRAKMVKEAGDVFWYLFMLLRELGIDPDEVAEANLMKLAKRREEDTIKGEGSDR